MFTLGEGLVVLPNSFAKLSLMDDLLAVVRVSHPDSKIAGMKSHADLPKGSSCLMLLASWSLMFCCLRKQTMHFREHVMLLISLLRNLLVPNKDITMKFPSHRLGSARTLALYGMTLGEEGSVEILILLVIAELGTSSRGTHRFDAGREKEKQVAFSAKRRKGSVISMSILQLAAIRSA